MQKNTNHRFLIGSWVSFYPFDIDNYEYQLDQMHQAGLNFNIFPRRFGGSIQSYEESQLIEEQYTARDMLYFINGGLTENGMQQGTAYAKDKPHCIGYHLKDEPGGAELANIGRCIRAYREADSARFPFVNLFPSYVGEAVMEGTYYEYCTRFVKEAGAENIEYLSHDYYPFQAENTNLGIFTDMEAIRRVALENGRLRTHAFPQSSAWNGMRMPNIDEMRWNVYAYLAYGFKALSWFNLVCPGNSDTEGECFRDSIIYRDGTIRDKQLFKDFGDLNREVLNLGDTLIKLDAIHAYHTQDDIAGVEFLPTDWMITPNECGNFVFSHFVTPSEDETYVMIFNRSWNQPVSATFRISEFSGIESLSYISPFNGNDYPVTVQDGIFTETFRPGEGKLYKLHGSPAYHAASLKNSKNDATAAEQDTPVEVLEPAPILIPKNATAEEILTLLPAAIAAVCTNQSNVTVTPLWDANELDTSLSGTKQLSCPVLLPDGSPAPAELKARIRITVAYDVDFTELDEALAVVNDLIEEEYSTDSWKTVRQYYEAALSMHDGSAPQNAVTVAAWQLLDRVRELEPVQWTLPSQDEFSEKPDQTGFHVVGGLLPTAISNLAGTVSHGFTEIFRSRFKKKKK